MPEQGGALALPLLVPSRSPLTFLFTDIEGSTALWEQDGARMSQALAAHDALARRAVEGHGGTVVKATGDGLHAVFDDAHGALAATVELQRLLTDPVATNGVPLRVRCGVHAGVVERRDNDYFGSPVNRAARIMGAAHGGQVLVSQAVVNDLQRILPASISLRDLGKVRLKDLSTPEHLYQVMHPDLRQEFPALRSLEATPNNLPQQLTSFIGREKELSELQQLLPKTRLMTLIGSGGCGKTRLCLQLAAHSLESFPDGAWLVELASLTDPELVAQAVTKVMGLKEEPDKSLQQTLTGHLKDKRLLVVLDNCEHLLGGCAQLCELVLRECPMVTILASSREALGISGEQAYRVASLLVPQPDRTHTAASIAPFESVQLFIERALLARPDFQVSDQNASALASVCYRLDGIPLAIELAAARVRSLSVKEINSKLDQRFLLLTGGSRTALPRQQTLRSLIDWSYDLLQDPEKLLLQRLSIFAGGWTLSAAEQTCIGEGLADGDILELLTSLVDKSLAVAEESEGDSRYRLLETVRRYARERLVEGGGEVRARKRHRDYVLALAEEAESNLLGANSTEWFRRLECEHENLRAALEWSFAEEDAQAGLRLCGTLQQFWWMHGYFSEGRLWCSRMLGKPGSAQQSWQRAKALYTAGVLAMWQSDYRDSVAYYEECLTIRQALGDRSDIASTLGGLGNVALVQGDYPTARRRLEECLAIRREMGQQRGIATSLNNLGTVAYEQGDFAAARELYAESLGIARQLGALPIIATALGNLGIVAHAQGDLAVAWTMSEEGLEINRTLGDRSGIARSLNNLGDLAYQRGDLSAALKFFDEDLAIARELGDRRAIAFTLEGLAGVFAKLGHVASAANIWGAMERLREDIEAPLPKNAKPPYDQRVVGARAALGDDAAFDCAWQEGRGFTPEKAMELATHCSQRAWEQGVS